MQVNYFGFLPYEIYEVLTFFNAFSFVMHFEIFYYKLDKYTLLFEPSSIFTIALLRAKLDVFEIVLSSFTFEPAYSFLTNALFFI